MTRFRRCAVLVAAAVLLAGCTQTPDVTRPRGAAPTAAATSADPPRSPRADSGPDLAARKRAAGIADCPASHPDVAPVDGGLPDLVLQCLGGGTPTRLAGLRGQPMLINVWAQWCPPCRQEAPFLAEVATVNRSNLMVLGIDFNDPRPELAIDFAEVASWRYPQLVDEDKAISAPLQISTIPQTLLVDAEGRIVYRHSGPFSSADQIRDLAQRHLGVIP